MREKRGWPLSLARIALALAVGALIAALLAAMGSAAGWWHFRPAFTVLRVAFFAAAGAGLLALAAIVAGPRNARITALAALIVGLGLAGYLGSQMLTARAMPLIHDVTTNLDDIPAFTRLPVRADNFTTVPAMGRAELEALPNEARWRAIHREAYGDLRTLRLASSPPDTVRRAEALARARGWEVVLVDPTAGTLEAVATSRFFRFKDNIVIRVRAAPGGGSLVDMRSLSRVGVSDIGVNAKRVRAFLKELAQPA